ncbi:metallophosphoesterase [Candidatus Moduliflexus flocculans]|uniref:Metallophosphoesterase n=1 Tax=Candidatus Moduliflexus flocculans TaxID=1499966 RepID=A0A0S6W3Q7_9BACT|nr:metallophosphoesterase [Candidatus Moduliflexus flocculans]
MVAGYVFFEPYWLKITTIPHVSPDIPSGFDGAKIVFLTDIHHGRFFPMPRLQKMVKTVNALQPDIVLFGGDYYQWNKKYIEPCFAELAKIDAPLGKFGVFGNHDYLENFLAVATPARIRAEIQPLDNQAYWVMRGGDRIKIGGVGDWQESSQDLRPTVQDATEGDFVLLVSHNPEYAEFIRTRKIDLVFSGHTHGGQMTLFGFWAPAPFMHFGLKYKRGLVHAPCTDVFISNGIGVTGLPVRFFARPEIVVLTLSRQQ